MRKLVVDISLPGETSAPGKELAILQLIQQATSNRLKKQSAV